MLGARGSESSGVIDLTGTWKLINSDGWRDAHGYAARPDIDDSGYLDAIVPGEVHLDLATAGLVGDPCHGLEALSSRWVEEQVWHYRRAFDAPNDACRGRAWIVLDQLDLVATVLLNGEEVGRHHNAFHPCRVEVTGRLLPGPNLLAVVVSSGLLDVGDKPAAGYVLGFDQSFTKRHWLRKPQYQFGWDWAPRCLNVGIGGSVRLEWTTLAARLVNMVPLIEVSPDLTSGRVRVRLHIEGLVDHNTTGRIRASLPETGSEATQVVVIRPGPQYHELTLPVSRPPLWWPAGHGLQPRCTVDADLHVGDDLVRRASAAVGFRRLVLNQEDHPQGGQRFRLEVNNRPIFVKGANLVPADLVLARLDRSHYARLTELALESNLNLLRVWGGGRYESDDFYECCDAKGILVWQEFAFACSAYPGDDADFVTSVQQEATHQVRRLACHPSLAVWCGNNEVDMVEWAWNEGRRPVHLRDSGLFRQVLPGVVGDEDPTRPYVPSSPHSPDGSDPNNPLVGDQHPWLLAFAETDFRVYRGDAARFPNEGGFLGPTALPTMESCLPEGQRHLGSFAWRAHDNAFAHRTEPGWADQMVRDWVGLEPLQMSLEDYAYWGGLLQGEALREYCENYRRRWPDTAAAVFWMFNDCWPATRSWSIVDYHLRRTPSFHPVRRSMAPIHVVLAEEGDEVVVFGLNDTIEPIEAELRFGLFHVAGGIHLDRREATALAPTSSSRLTTFPRREWSDPAASVAFAVLEQGDGEVVARSRLILPRFTELAWAAPELSVTVGDGRATFASDTFVWGVCLDLSGGDDGPADNFFDVWPEMPYVLPWASAEAPRPLRVGNLNTSAGGRARGPTVVTAGR